MGTTKRDEQLVGIPTFASSRGQVSRRAAPVPRRAAQISGRAASMPRRPRSRLILVFKIENERLLYLCN